MLTVVVLAAGQGKRMQSDLPKVLHTLAGKPMLFHVLETARSLGPDRIVVVVGHGGGQIADALADQPDITLVTQPQQLGTGHAVQQAVAALKGPAEPGDTTLVLYGDVPLVQAQTLQALLQARSNGLALLTETLADPTGYGRIVRDSQGKVQRIVEQKDASDTELAITEVNTGILAAASARLAQWLGQITNDNAQGEFYLTDVIGLAVADGVAVHTAQASAAWETAGVNTRAQQAWLERQWQLEQAGRLLEQGVTLADPARFDVRGTLVCGRDVFIDVGCVFVGEVTLADGVRVGPHCVVNNTQVGAGASIEAFSHVSQARVGAGASVGPYARLRPGADLGPQVHVGNFVEIKNTRLGTASKVSHLSYVGDAQVGERVNIGAGTITCNYDGANKHQTIIEDDVFIGSDTQLVAPITVGAGATVGAGTTLVKDAPAGQLTLSRSEQQTIRHWARPTKKS